MRRLTLTALVAATLAAMAPATASAARPAQSIGTAIPAPTVITTRIDGVPMSETYDGGGGLPYLGSARSYNAGDWEPVLREYHDTGVYQAQILKVDALADRWVRHAARRHRGHGGQGRHRGHGRDRGHGRQRGHGHQRGQARHRGHGRDRGLGPGQARPARRHGGARSLALVLDIDETSLSNYTAIAADDFTYGPASQAEATDQVGTAIDSTLQLFNDAKAAGVAVFFVTGRPEAQRQDTTENLQREGYSGWKQLYLKPAGTTATTVAYKTGARTDIESQGYRIVANVGDQYSDLAGSHARRAFKLANPFYFLP